MNDVPGNIVADTVLNRLMSQIEQRRYADPKKSYVAKLLARAPDSILKKVGEETAELIMASKDAQSEQIIYECADIWFHTLVLLAHHHLSVEQVLAELQRREGVSGIVEKAGRSE